MSRGLTFVELAIVVVIAGILTGLVIPIYQGMIDDSKWAEARSAVGTVRSALDVYKCRHSGRLPGLSAGEPVMSQARTFALEAHTLGDMKYFDTADFTFESLDTSTGHYTIAITGSKPDSPPGTYRFEHDGTTTGP